MPLCFWRSQSAQWWGKVSSVSAWPQETLNPLSSSTCLIWTSPSTKQTAGTTSTRTQTGTRPQEWSSYGRKVNGSTTAALLSTSTAASPMHMEERAYFWSCSKRVSRQLYLVFSLTISIVGLCHYYHILFKLIWHYNKDFNTCQMLFSDIYLYFTRKQCLVMTISCYVSWSLRQWKFLCFSTNYNKLKHRSQFSINSTYINPFP